MAYFIPRGGIYYRCVAHYSPFIRYMATVVLLGGVMAGWFFYIHTPYAMQKQQLTQRLDTIHDISKREHDIADQIGILKQEIQSLHHAAPSHREHKKSSIDLLSQALTRHNVTLKSFNYNNAAHNEHSYDMYCELVGKGDQLLALLNSLSQSKLYCSHVVIQHGDEHQCVMKLALYSIK